MSIPIAPLPEGTRVRVKRWEVPQDPAVTGRTGTVVSASEYHPERLGVVLDAESEVRFFLTPELEAIELPALPPEREEAKSRRALP